MDDNNQSLPFDPEKPADDAHPPAAQPQASVPKPAGRSASSSAKVPAKPDPASDVIDRLIECLQQLPELSKTEPEALQSVARQLRHEFGGQGVYIAKTRRSPAEVQRLFDGRNATTVARKLGISRASVYRYLKQPGASGEGGRGDEDGEEGVFVSVS